MSWMDSASVASSQTCEPCLAPLVLKRFNRDKTCATLTCVESAEFELYATIQPARNEHLSEIERSKLGERQSGMVVVHYYPLSDRHTEQNENGIYIRTSDANFHINDFNAATDNGCADRLIYQGQVWRAVKTDCAHTCCNKQEELDWVCRAWFCLDNCKTDDSQNPQVAEDWLDD